MHRSGLLIFLCAFGAAAQNSSKPQFTARELFYSAANESAAKPAPKAAPAPTPPPNTKKSTPAPKKAEPPVQVAVADPPRVVNQHTVPTPLPGGATLIKASASTAPAPDSGTPLGLKYTLLKLSGSDMVEVEPDTVFHAGDKIQLSVQTNGPGYLYIISQGSSGTWQPMFPDPDIDAGNNHVDGWNARVLPPGRRMVFDEKTGTEKIFVVFSRSPEDGLENIIYSLQGGAKTAKPVKDDVRPPAKQMTQIASARIDNATVGRLRDSYTRDLIIEKVDDKTPADKAGSKKEKAIYVVNPSGSSDSRVVADIQLVHQ